MDAQGGLRLLVGASDRHEQDVVEVARARAREVRMAKAGYGRVGIEIARDPIPSGQPVVGAQLHHAERHLRSRIGITREVRANQRIHHGGQVVGRRLCSLIWGASREQKPCAAYPGKDVFHVVNSQLISLDSKILSLGRPHPDKAERRIQDSRFISL